MFTVKFGHRSWTMWYISLTIMTFTISYRASLRAQSWTTPRGIKLLEANVEKHFPDIHARLEWHRKAVEDLQIKIDAEQDENGFGNDKVDVVAV
jgi:hypothetical protein